MMQRSSNGTQRVLLIVGIVSILIVGVLYFMKRAEANRLSSTLDTIQVNTVAWGPGRGEEWGEVRV